MAQTAMQISPGEFITRSGRLFEYIKETGYSGVVLFDSTYILYYTGFAFIPTERPVAFALNAAGEKALFVPRLEVEHAQVNSQVDRVDSYLEYPFKPHPFELLKHLLADLGMNGPLGADHDGYPWIFGYRGPALSELTGKEVRPVTAFIEDQMMIKSPAEVDLIRESIKWSNLAHTLLQRYTKAGLTETEVSQRASGEATLAMLDAIGPVYRSLSAFGSGASAYYRGQIGRSAAIPHTLANNITFRPGDVLVSEANAPVWGYNSELERTMIFSQISGEQQRMFAHMLALQDLALGTLRPGIPCSEVDRVVRSYYEAQELMPFWKHHVGHSIGLRYHEGPFLDLGDQTIIQPGMVFTIEPGLYSPELGGFRHSDTVLVQDAGIEILTYYPRDLDSLTIG
jgi:Xaa-Pro dipeptidase